MSDDRPVSTDALRTLGMIIDATEARDAIHLAVEPTVARQRLKPGQHVGINGTPENPVGIVDPFLTKDVQTGERFWLIVYPRTITSLRHVWAHPAFPDTSEVRSSASESEKWMRAWAMEHVSDDYYGGGDKISEDEAYKFAIRAGYDHYIGPYESASDYIDTEWWSHWEAITGTKGDRDAYFTCGC